MQKCRILFFQFLGIIMLLAGYLINDIPDSRSEMHFDLSDTHVIAAGQRDDGYDEEKQIVTDHNNKGHQHKHKHHKRGIFNVILPEVPLIVIFSWQPVHNTFYQQPENYFFLFHKEVNPPPPRYV